MNSKELLGVGIRLLGIYLLYLSAQKIITYVPVAIIYTENNYPNLSSFYLFSGLEVLLIGLCGLIFIKFPLTISRLVYPGAGDDTVDFGADAKSAIRLFSCLLGLFILVNAIPELMDNLTYILFNKNQFEYAEAVANAKRVALISLFEIFMGAYLCFWCGSVASLILRLRRRSEKI